MRDVLRAISKITMALLTLGLASCQSYEENNRPFKLNDRNTLYACTAALAKFRNDRQKYTGYGYIAFAKGPAFTETGMRGCGWTAFAKTQEAADAKAMAGCTRVAANPSRCVVIER
jgi:hypothetical protein